MTILIPMRQDSFLIPILILCRDRAGNPDLSRPWLEPMLQTSRPTTQATT